MRQQLRRSEAEGKELPDTVLGLADTSCQWDFREFRVRRGQGFRGKGIRDAVVVPLPPPCISPWVGVPRLGLG